LYSNIKNLVLVRSPQRHLYVYRRNNGHSFAHQLYKNDSSFFISYQKSIDFFKHFWLNLSVYIWLFNVPMKIWRNLKIAAAAVAFLWLVFLINQVNALDLRLWGLRPRTIEGLPGIFLAPFLHGDIAHLVANSGACFVLLTVALSFSLKLASKAILIIIIVGGGLVWLLGSSHAIHIGASGVIFGLIGFLMSLGAWRREWPALLVSAIVLVLYGGAVQSLLVYTPGTSWAGHLFGFVSGVLAAWWTKKERAT